MHYRILAALGIIDGTLSILAGIFYKLYMRKNPSEQSALQTNRGWSLWVWLLILYLFFQIGGFVFMALGFWLN